VSAAGETRSRSDQWKIHDRRKHATRARSIKPKSLTRASIALGRILYPDHSDRYERPVTRADCLTGGCNEARPCPWVSCKHHLYLDVSPFTGSIKLNFPDLEVWERGETCALDVAERDGVTLEEIGEHMNLTRERVRQVLVDALEALSCQRALKRMR